MGVDSRKCIVTFGGFSSTELGVTVEGYPGSVKPEKDIETEAIPGRNGDLLYDYQTYRNYDEYYTCHWRKNRELYDNEDYNTAKNYSTDYRVLPWLMLKGYQRFEDSFHPFHYRMAYIYDAFEVQNIMNQLGRAEISFNFKPQWFRKDGDTAITISSSGYTLKNSGMDALPLMIVKGSGNCVVSINDMSVNIKSVPANGIVLDSELQDAYSPDKSSNLNSIISISGDKFPILKYGENTISYTGNVSSITITPRWWDLL